MFEFLGEVITTEFIIGNSWFSDTGHLTEDGRNSSTNIFSRVLVNNLINNRSQILINHTFVRNLFPHCQYYYTFNNFVQKIRLYMWWGN